MPLLTYYEYQHTTLCAVDDVIYNRISAQFRRVLGDKADAFLRKYYGYTIQRLTAQSVVDLTKCFTLI